MDGRWRLHRTSGGAVPYRLIGHTAITVGSPLCEPEAARSVLGEFADRCVDTGWRLVVVDAPAPLDGRLHSYRLSRAAIVEAAGFSLEGARMANLRHTVARARRASLEVALDVWGRVPEPDRRQIHEVSSVWSSGRYALAFLYGARGGAGA